MWYLETGDHHTNAYTFNFLAQCMRHFFGKHIEVRNVIIIKVKVIIDFKLRYYKGVSIDHRVDIKKRITPVIFSNLIRRDFP